MCSILIRLMAHERQEKKKLKQLLMPICSILRSLRRIRGCLKRCLCNTTSTFACSMDPSLSYGRNTGIQTTLKHFRAYWMISLIISIDISLLKNMQRIYCGIYAFQASSIVLLTGKPFCKLSTFKMESSWNLKIRSSIFPCFMMSSLSLAQWTMMLRNSSMHTWWGAVRPRGRTGG